MTPPQTDVTGMKRAGRLTEARLVLTRANREIALAPGARATPLIRDMRLALVALIEEVEHDTQ